MNKEVFINFAEMTPDQIRELIDNQITRVEHKTRGDITPKESENIGFLLWNCKMIFRNIYMACDKLLNKYPDSLDQDETKKYSNLSSAIKNDEPKWNSLESIEKTLRNIYFIDKKYLEEVVDDLTIETDIIAKYLPKISQLMNLSFVQCREFSKFIYEVKAMYFYDKKRGGKMVIVASDGSYLGAGSSMNFDKLLEEFKKGKRSGNFNEKKKEEQTQAKVNISYDLMYNDICFNISTNKFLGDLTNPNKNLYKVGNKITIIFGNCSEPNILPNRAGGWLKNSASKNNQNVIKNYNRSYTLNNEQINVIERAVIKNDVIKWYKFTYYDHVMIVFGYNDLELSDSIDKMIVDLKITKE